MASPAPGRPSSGGGSRPASAGRGVAVFDEAPQLGVVPEDASQASYGAGRDTPSESGGARTASRPGSANASVPPPSMVYHAQAAAVGVNSLPLTDLLTIRESWRAVVRVTALPSWMMPSASLQRAREVIRASHPRVLAVTYNHMRPFDVTVDLTSERARAEFVEFYDGRIVKAVVRGEPQHGGVVLEEDEVMPKENNITLSVHRYEGPTEGDWLKFFPPSEPGGVPTCDTVVIRNLPAQWFGVDAGTTRDEFFDPASELRRAFGHFGVLRNMGIDVHTPSTPSDLEPAVAAELSTQIGPIVPVVDVYLQFRDYDGFHATLSALSNCTLLWTPTGAACACEATYDVKGYFSRTEVRKREAIANLRKQQLEIKRQEALKDVQQAKNRIRAVKRKQKQQLKALAEQMDYVRRMRVPDPEDAVIVEALASAEMAAVKAGELGVSCGIRVVELDMSQSAYVTKAVVKFLGLTRKDNPEYQRRGSVLTPNDVRDAGQAKAAADAAAAAAAAAGGGDSGADESKAGEPSTRPDTAVTSDSDTTATTATGAPLKSALKKPMSSGMLKLRRAVGLPPPPGQEFPSDRPDTGASGVSSVTGASPPSPPSPASIPSPLPSRPETAEVTATAASATDASVDARTQRLRAQKRAEEAIEETPTYDPAPLKRAILKARKLVRTAEQICDDAISRENQKLPDLRTAMLDVCKCKLFWEAWQKQFPRPPTKGVTIFAVRDGGFLEAAGVDEVDERHRPPGTPSPRGMMSFATGEGLEGLALPPSLGGSVSEYAGSERGGSGAGDGATHSAFPPGPPRDGSALPPAATAPYPETPTPTDPRSHAGPPHSPISSGAASAPRSAVDGGRGPSSAVDLLLDPSAPDGDASHGVASSAGASRGNMSAFPPGAGGSATLPPLSHAETADAPPASAGAGSSTDAEEVGTFGRPFPMHAPEANRTTRRLTQYSEIAPTQFSAHSKLVGTLAKLREVSAHYQNLFEQHTDDFGQWWKEENAIDAAGGRVTRTVKADRQKASLSAGKGPDTVEIADTRSAGERARDKVRKAVKGIKAAQQLKGDRTMAELEEDNPYKPPPTPPKKRDTIWEARCMNVHMIPGPYTIQDLCAMDSGRMPLVEESHQLRTRTDVNGKYVVWVEPTFDVTGTSEHAHNDQFDGLMQRLARRKLARSTAYRSAAAAPAPRASSPELYMRAKVVKSNVWVDGGTVIHVLDRIMFPDGFAEERDF